MREINAHRFAGPASKYLHVEAMDEPNETGASHVYEITGFGEIRAAGFLPGVCRLIFQKGSLQDMSTNNGITEATLLAVVLDRLKGFQAGPAPCRENAIIITKLEEALHWIEHRVRDRSIRGVQGTLQP